MSMKMICEQASGCAASGCDHIEEHTLNDECDFGHCQSMNGCRGGKAKCNPVTSAGSKEEVFCEGCESLLYPAGSRRFHDCCHKDNITKGRAVSWLRARPIKAYLRKPDEINKDNDCKWWKEQRL